MCSREPRGITGGLMLAERLSHFKMMTQLSDRQLLGGIVQSMDDGQDYLSGNNCYGWYYAAGRCRAPKTIAEVGVRFGYSLKAMALGAKDAGVRPALYGYDAESYVPGSLNVCRAHLSDQFALTLHKMDTQHVGALEISGIDLFHVDADHSMIGCMHDLELAWPCIGVGGWLLVDDVVNINEVRAGVDEFAKKIGQRSTLVGSFRGMAIFVKV
jgi:hypothetical protein